jgi:protein arginine N-methyltransferase 5
MITRPITTSSFQTKVLSALDAYFKTVSASAKAEDVPYPMIAPLTPEDTTLLPDEFISTTLAVTSPWIDLASPDPAVAHVSRQVLNLEIAYAAFCGASNVIVEGPRLSGDSVIPQFARAMAQALNAGAYLNLQIRLPMTGTEQSEVTEDSRHLASRSRKQYTGASDKSNTSDPLRSWDAWELIRTVCKFHSRLSVGKIYCLSFFLFAFQSAYYRR